MPMGGPTFISPFEKILPRQPTEVITSPRWKHTNPSLWLSGLWIRISKKKFYIFIMTPAHFLLRIVFWWLAKYLCWQTFFQFNSAFRCVWIAKRINTFLNAKSNAYRWPYLSLWKNIAEASNGGIYYHFTTLNSYQPQFTAKWLRIRI